MIRILILEDTPQHYRVMKNAIEHHFGELVCVFPEYGPEGNELREFNDLIHEVRAEKGTSDAELKGLFDLIDKRYSDIDLYVIDVILRPNLNTLDEFGFLYHEHLISELANKDVKAVVMSNHVHAGSMAKQKNVRFFSKLEFGGDNLGLKVVDEFKDLFGVGALPGFIAGQGREKNYTIENRAGRWIDGIGKPIVDVIIRGVFCLLLMACVLWGLFGVGHEFIDVMGKWLSKENTTTLTVSLLKLIEGIFLSLIPVFVVFGFMIYYLSNVRVAFLEGNMSNVNPALSVHAMHLTKKLFIASVLSVVLLQFIEAVIEKDLAKEKEWASALLLAALSILLMIYNLKLEHGKDASDGS